jgi:hypothetical protein
VDRAFHFGAPGSLLGAEQTHGRDKTGSAEKKRVSTTHGQHTFLHQ